MRKANVVPRFLAYSMMKKCCSPRRDAQFQKDMF